MLLRDWIIHADAPSWILNSLGVLDGTLSFFVSRFFQELRRLLVCHRLPPRYTPFDTSSWSFDTSLVCCQQYALHILHGSPRHCQYTVDNTPYIFPCFFMELRHSLVCCRHPTLHFRRTFMSPRYSSVYCRHHAFVISSRGLCIISVLSTIRFPFFDTSSRRFHTLHYAVGKTSPVLLHGASTSLVCYRQHTLHLSIVVLGILILVIVLSRIKFRCFPTERGHDWCVRQHTSHISIKNVGRLDAHHSCFDSMHCILRCIFCPSVQIGYALNSVDYSNTLVHLVLPSTHSTRSQHHGLHALLHPLDPSALIGHALGSMDYKLGCP